MFEKSFKSATKRRLESISSSKLGLKRFENVVAAIGLRNYHEGIFEA